MGTSLTLFRVFGIDVRVHWSFVLILAYGAFIYSAGPAGPLVGALYGILVILLLFGSVTLHEMGHAVVAKYYKVNVAHITLLPIGGVASLERMPDKPLHEFLITLAGPLVNFILAIILVPLTLLAAMLELGRGNFPTTVVEFLRMMQTPGVTNILVYLLGANIMLGLFNLLPAFPMDGGRILRSLLAMTMSYVQATRTAVLVGRLMAGLFAIWGLFTGNIVMLLIAFFVYVGGGAEREAVESRALLRNVKAGTALTPEAASLYASERLSRAVDLLMNTYQTDYPVRDLSGKFIGVLTRPRLIAGLREFGPEARVVDVMIPEEQVVKVAPTADLSEVWVKMASGGGRVVAVNQGPEFLGLITMDDVCEIMQVVAASMANERRPPRFDSRVTPADRAGGQPTERTPV